MQVKKTSLHLARRRAFLGIHPRAHGVLLTIVMATRPESTRFRVVDRFSANRYHAELLLSTPADIDDDVVRWVQVAWEEAG